MALVILNILLALALAGLTYKYVELQEEHRRETIPDLCFLEGVSHLFDGVEGYGRSHAIEMSREAEAIGRHLDLDAKTIVSLKIAALLHDCGQVQIPRELLKSRRPLTSDEWFLVKAHPVLGEMSLRKALPAWEEVPSIIRWHHERWDGSGYPDRLMGEEIPVTARILAVVDAAAAMGQERPYRAACNAARIDSTLESMSGLMFDPRIIQARIDVRKAASS